VGMATNRSYVVRGSKMGVFKHNENDETELVTQISKLTMKNGEIFSPTKVMLHQGEHKMLLLNDKRPDTVFALDLERQKVVEEWKTQDDMAVGSIAPTEKYAQMTTEQNIVAVNRNAVFRMDPRQKAPIAQSFVYKTIPDMTSINTNGLGHIAVGSAKGEIRMFKDCTMRAKTLLPGLGDAIVGIDVTENGQWILATTKSYLMVIPTLREDGRTGFEVGMGQQKKPPIKLQLKKDDLMKYNISETSFTSAHFDTGDSITEEWIVSSTGPYIITWDFKKVQEGKNVYKIKQLNEEIMGDQFVYNQKDKVIVTTEDDIYLQKRTKK